MLPVSGRATQLTGFACRGRVGRCAKLPLRVAVKPNILEKVPRLVAVTSTYAPDDKPSR